MKLERRKDGCGEGKASIGRRKDEVGENTDGEKSGINST